MAAEANETDGAATEAGEFLGRLKPNGRLLSRSPLTDGVEYELMRLGITGKLSCWRALRGAAARDQRLSAPALDGLIVRAESQLALLERRWLRAAATAFG